MSISNYLETAVMNWLRGTAAPAAPSAVYLALFSSDPGDDNSGTEVTATIRPAGRVAVTFGAVTQDGAGAAQISNTAIVDFGASAGAVPNLSHVGFFDAAAAGNLLWSAALQAAKPVTVGDPVTFPVGAVTLNLN